MERVRVEAKAKPNQLLEVREFLHPQIDEITDTMPTRLGAGLRRSRTFRRLVDKLTHNGMILNTTSVAGYTLLTTMARVRPLRPRSLRFVREQRAIESWIGQGAGGRRRRRPRAGDRRVPARSSRATARPTSTARRASRS